MFRSRWLVLAVLLAWASAPAVPAGHIGLNKPPKPDLTHDQFDAVLSESLGPAPKSGGELIVIPVKGSFDYYVDTDSPVVHPAIFDSMIRVALAREPAAIVLDVDSPGGYVWVMHVVIDRILELQQERGVRVVAWPRTALSAAAMATVACKEIVVRPTCLLGAATTLIGEDEAPEDESALDRKAASVDDARRRLIATVTNRPVSLQNAMQHPTARLWYHDEHGFTDALPSTDGWRTLDDRDDRPMALHAEELVACGVAVGTAADEQSLLQALGLSSSTACVTLDPWSDSVRLKLKPIHEAWDEYWQWARRYASRLLDELVKKIDLIKVTRRSAGIIASREHGYTDREHRELARQIASCMNLPQLNEHHKEALALFGLTECVDGSIHSARSVLKRARQSMFVNRQTIPIGAIDDDLVEAHNLLVQIFNGCTD